VDGILVVDKPAGMTSHDVVALARRRLRERRVGHAGTLDPPATGVLVLGVGRATRLLRFVEAHDKTYEAEVVLGLATSTQDATGEPLEEADASRLTAGDLEAALAALTGEIEQVPPMVSAIKVGGERLYRKARRGEEVERPRRRVRVHEIALLAFSPGRRARARIRVRCSPGTYVRTIAHDLGAALGVGGHVAALRRLRVGPFLLEGAVPPERISPEALRPMLAALEGYPVREVSETEARAVAAGRPLPALGVAGPHAIVGPTGLVAVAEDRDGFARPLCVLGTPA
jgi:tRNA pseudouridine55 synthase